MHVRLLRHLAHDDAVELDRRRHLLGEPDEHGLPALRLEPGREQPFRQVGRCVVAPGLPLDALVTCSEEVTLPRDQLVQLGTGDAQLGRASDEPSPARPAHPEHRTVAVHGGTRVEDRPLGGTSLVVECAEKRGGIGHWPDGIAEQRRAACDFQPFRASTTRRSLRGGHYEAVRPFLGLTTSGRPVKSSSSGQTSASSMPRVQRHQASGFGCATGRSALTSSIVVASDGSLSGR